MVKILTYTVLLNTPFNKTTSLQSALKFCQEIVRLDHRAISCLFLQTDAAYLGMTNMISLENQINISYQWQEFVSTHQLPAFICTNSALQRGITDQHFAEVYSKQVTLAPMFQLAGLGTLFTAIENSDRFIQL